MKQTINFSQFVDGFSNRKDNFSYDGLKELFSFLKDQEDACEVELEFDPIAICCDFKECGQMEFIESYGALDEIDIDDMDEEDVDEAVQKWGAEQTWCIRLDNKNLLFQNF